MTVADMTAEQRLGTLRAKARSARSKLIEKAYRSVIYDMESKEDHPRTTERIAAWQPAKAVLCAAKPSDQLSALTAALYENPQNPEKVNALVESVIDFMARTRLGTGHSLTTAMAMTKWFAAACDTRATLGALSDSFAALVPSDYCKAASPEPHRCCAGHSLELSVLRHAETYHSHLRSSSFDLIFDIATDVPAPPAVIIADTENGDIYPWPSDRTMTSHTAVLVLREIYQWIYPVHINEMKEQIQYRYADEIAEWHTKRPPLEGLPSHIEDARRIMGSLTESLYA